MINIKKIIYWIKYPFCYIRFYYKMNKMSYPERDLFLNDLNLNKSKHYNYNFYKNIINKYNLKEKKEKRKVLKKLYFSSLNYILYLNKGKWKSSFISKPTNKEIVEEMKNDLFLVLSIKEGLGF